MEFWVTQTFNGISYGALLWTLTFSMKNSQMKRIGIIGVGLLGSAVASRLLKGGFEVAAYDTRLEQVEALQAQGLVAAASIAAAAAEADAVFTILPSLESVETTILGAGGLIETAPQNCTVIQMSTVSPNLTRRLGNAAAAKALGFLDAPMSGTSAMVERGDCTIFAGGDQKLVAACQPMFAAIAKRTTHVGAVSRPQMRTWTPLDGNKTSQGYIGA